MIGFIGTSIIIKTNYNNSQSVTLCDSLHSQLDYERLLFHCDEWRKKNHCSLSRVNWTNSFITSRRTKYVTMSYSSSVIVFLCLFVATGTCLLNCCPAMDYSSLLSRKRVLASRWLAIDYSGFQAPYHNIMWVTCIRYINSVAFSPQAHYTDRVIAACRRS
jgi:hypothetical protein